MKPNDLGKQIGMTIKKLREEKNWSQRELSRRSGINSATISLIESCGSSPTIDTLDQLAEGLNVHLLALIGESSGLQPGEKYPTSLPKIDPDTAKNFDQWCEKTGRLAELYHTLALWLVVHMDAESREKCLEAMQQNPNQSLKLIPDDPRIIEDDDELVRELERAMDETEDENGEEPGKSHKAVG